MCELRQGNSPNKPEIDETKEIKTLFQQDELGIPKTDRPDL